MSSKFGKVVDGLKDSAGEFLEKNRDEIFDKASEVFGVSDSSTASRDSSDRKDPPASKSRSKRND